MPGRLKTYGKKGPDGLPDQGLARQYEGANPLAKVVTSSGVEKFEQVNPAEVQTKQPAAGQAMVSAQSGKRENVAPVGGASFEAQGSPRGHQPGSFAAAKGNAPKRSASSKPGPALDIATGSKSPEAA